MFVVMRYAEGHKQQVRERILKAAAVAFRAHGLEGVSIPALMKEVGLTHGGFYAHFESRDALVAEAVTEAARQTRDTIFGVDRDATLEQATARYVHPDHVNHPEQGCPMAALAPELLRAPKEAQDAMRAAAERFLLELERARTGQRATAYSEDTLRTAALMLGSVLVGRVLGDDALPGRLMRPANSPSPPTRH